MYRVLLILFSLLLFSLGDISFIYAKEDSKDDLELIDIDDLEVLRADDMDSSVDPNKTKELNLSDREEEDDLDALLNDIGPLIKEKKVKEKKAVVTKKKKIEIVEKEFDVGAEEKELLKVAKFIEKRIPDKEWEEISGQTKESTYVVTEGDWLWKISKKLFGTGFYYPKIWALNKYITNPHEIEPGMTLVFNTGTDDAPPDIQLGSFSESDKKKIDYSKLTEKQKRELKGEDYYNQFGDEIIPEWIKRKKSLLAQGVFVESISKHTYPDLEKKSRRGLNQEWKKYEPPASQIEIKEPGENYDSAGFDRTSKVDRDYKEGFYLNTFVTTNVVHDYGYIEKAQSDSLTLTMNDVVYVRFDALIKPSSGDKFSIYSPEGKVLHKLSDRVGYQYVITGHIETVRPIEDQYWECLITDTIKVVKRKDRITVHTPKIERITKTFNNRNVEAVVMGFALERSNGSFGDVVYLDRGRKDGIEMGNVFEIFAFKDRSSGKKISMSPTYKIGELAVITLTDNFATAIITNSSQLIQGGTLATTKSVADAAKKKLISKNGVTGRLKKLENAALEELDVELNLSDVNKNLLDKADQIKLTEDELEELERQEREKSIIKGYENDLKQLESIEKDIERAEMELNEEKIDEDKLLENENLNELEKKKKRPGQDAFASLKELENKYGKKYLDEKLNSKDNPYGLTEYDLEEIDDLLSQVLSEESED